MIVRVNSFMFGNFPVHRIDFIVGGSEVGEEAGVIGQNILHIADVEYDLAHGRVSLFRPHDCGKSPLGYWSAGQPLSELDTADDTDGFHHTYAQVTVNGQHVRAMFDSGAASTVLSRLMATRLGIKLDGPGVEQGRFSSGIGRRKVATWIVPVAKIEIGGEEVRNNRIEVSDLGDTEMLIGVDFFMAHRIYVANDQHKIYFTYLGGTLFNTERKNVRAVDGDGKPLDLTDRADIPSDAEGYSRRGMALASRGRIDAAIADLDKAVSLMPGEPRYLVQRATPQRNAEKPALALADLDHALTLKPDDTDALVNRAVLQIYQGDAKAALKDVKAADKATADAANIRFIIASLYSQLDQQAAAVTSYTAWIDNHPVDSDQPSARNGRCWARALSNQDLAKALADCNAALRMIHHKEVVLDSRGLVKLRMGDFAGAREDYDAALTIEPKLAWSLYGRGLAKQKLGDKAGGMADIAAANALAPKLAKRAEQYGLTP